MLFNNTGEDIKIEGCNKAESIASNALVELGSCGESIKLIFESGKTFSYQNISSLVLKSWHEFEPFMEFKMTNRGGIIKLQINSSGQAFIASKEASLPELHIPEQPIGFPLSAVVTQ